MQTRMHLPKLFYRSPLHDLRRFRFIFPTYLFIGLLTAVALLLLAPRLLAQIQIAHALADTQTLVWTRQFGSPNHDSASRVAVAADGIYVTGNATGALPNQSHAGDLDAFVRKYDGAGNELWTHQFGTIYYDEGTDIAVNASGVYVVGYTGAVLPGQVSAGGDDVFVRKYDSAGNEQWTRQFGSVASDHGLGIVVDTTGVYVTGFTGGTLPGQHKLSIQGSSDAFIRKYDPMGNPLWTRQFGVSDSTWGKAVAIDAAGIYVAGSWRQSGGDSHLFVQKFNLLGKPLWLRQLASAAQDLPEDIAVDTSGVYVAGHTFGSLPGQQQAGHVDVFVYKLSTAGKPLWTRQFGTTASDSATGVTTDATGVYVAGTTWGVMAGQVNAGASDLFMRKYDATGTELWTRQFGSGAEDQAHSIATNAAGIYLAGLTGGALLGQTSAGLGDAFVLKYEHRSLIDNLLRNGGFEVGTTNWEFYTDGQGEFTTTGPAYTGAMAAAITVTEKGENTQLYQTGFVLEPKTRYQLRFAAYSTTGRDLSVYVQQHNSPYTVYGLRNFRANLTKQWQLFTVTFTTKAFKTTTTDTRLRFWLAPFAKAGDQYWIDDVSLIKLPPQITAAAQSGSGLIAGRVAGVDGVTAVALADLETGGALYQVTVATDATGTFQLAQVPFGSYELRVTPPVGYLAPEPVQLLVTEEPNEEIMFMIESATDTLYLPQITR